MKQIRLLRRAFLILSALSAASLSLAAADWKPFYLHSGDTVVFYGDSITDQRLYTMLTELFAVTRYPTLNVTFVHSGWGGDRVTGGGGGPIALRLQRDVFAYNPTVLTIMLGMNDGKYANHTAADDATYFSGYQHIVDAVRQKLPEERITVIEPSPYDDVTRPFILQPDGYNAVLLKYSDWLQKMAEDKRLDVADLNRPVVEMLRAANTSDPVAAQKIIPDRVHPGLAGHLIMAEQLLKAWNARPVVSDVAIDAAAGNVSHSAFATITDVHAGEPLSWTEADESLPLPLADLLAGDRDHSLALAIHSSDVTQALNREPLQVTGLKPGSYKLTIDGAAVGTWTAGELAQGINLAEFETPMSKQAMGVRDLTVSHIEMHQFRWRTLQAPLENVGLQNLGSTEKALDSLEAEVVARQRAAAQPKPHAYRIAAVQ